MKAVQRKLPEVTIKLFVVTHVLGAPDHPKVQLFKEKLSNLQCFIEILQQ